MGDNKIMSKPYDKAGEETYERVFGKKEYSFNCEYRPCSLTKPFGNDYIHTMCGEKCFIRKEIKANRKLLNIGKENV